LFLKVEEKRREIVNLLERRRSKFGGRKADTDNITKEGFLYKREKGEEDEKTRTRKVEEKKKKRSQEAREEEEGRRSEQSEIRSKRRAQVRS